jgi:hypothetical protein
VWLDRAGGLWMLERAPAGNIIVTTAYPMYAEGTTEFLVLEARHSTGAIVLGGESFGTCKVLD